MRHGVRTLPLLAALVCGYGVLFGLPVLAAKLYVWYDAEGVPHYTDQPRPGAKEVEIQSAPGTGAPAVAPSARPSRPVAKPKPSDAAPANPYVRLEIVQPAADESIVNTGGRVDVVAVIEPELAPGHLTWFLLDGQRLEDAQRGATQVSLDLPRGTHRLRLQVVDQQNRVIAASPEVEFHVRQPSLQANPPQGPALQRPRPKKP